jgi:predicted porin
MKKHLLAAALIAGFAGSAGAQSSVTLYGVADGGLGYTQFKRDSRQPGDQTNANSFGAWDGAQSSNRWGLKGAEDLGGDLQAIFNLESGFSLANGTSGQSGRLFGRGAFVGLKSKSWGQIAAGRQKNFGYDWLAGVATPFGVDFNQSRASGAFSTTELRFDNQIQYQSPDFSGFQFGIGYSFQYDGTVAFDPSGEQANVRAWTAALRYTSGPLAAIVTYDQRKNRTAGVGGADRGLTVSSWNVAGSYDFQAVKLHLAFGLTEDGWFGLPSQLRLDDDLDGTGAFIDRSALADYNDQFRAYSYGVGVGIPLGANSKLLAGWTMLDPDKNGVKNAGRNLKSQHVFGLAYTYNLSKRTNLYLTGAYISNLALIKGQKAMSLGGGLRHQF